ncbi:MAG: carbohydrate-binding domain-containing protein [Desulfobacterales bacterium]|nr:carbohydrate-binding domain-containing protein [Desulfobacterales bacterium]
MKKIFSVGLLCCVIFLINFVNCFASSDFAVTDKSDGLTEYKAGDVNQSGEVDLVDLILILKVMSGVLTDQTIHVSADVNGDNKIGLREAVYILQSVSDISADSEATLIVLNGNSISVDGPGATADNSKVTVTSAGTYSLSGSLADGQVIVNTEDEEDVRLILNGVDIRNSASAPVYVVNAEKTVIVLADDTENYLTDGKSYIFEDPEKNEPNAAVFSNDDLTFSGTGSLTVDGNFNDGIASEDDLKIKSGTIIVNSEDDGIRGKDSLIVKAGNITVNAKGDGLKSDNDEDAEKGYISVEDGVINITSGGDAVQAETSVAVTGGEIMLTSGGGSNSSIDEDTSAKGIRGGVSIIVDSGAFTIDSADDAIYSDENLTINGGTFVISSGDDGIHADSLLEINGGNINITKSYEGIESEVVKINNGDIRIVSSDDGLNVAGGSDGSGTNRKPGDVDPSGDYYLYVNGGSVVINAGGDGVDVNGSIEMTDGVVIVNGPTDDRNGALDCDGSFTVTGGFLAAAGSSRMAQAPDSSSTQYSVLLLLGSPQQAGSLIHIQTSDGKGILTFEPAKEYQSVAFSSPELIKGSSYDVYYGGSSTGVADNSLYQDEIYTPGTRYASFTVSDIVTRVE